MSPGTLYQIQEENCAVPETSPDFQSPCNDLSVFNVCLNDEGSNLVDYLNIPVGPDKIEDFTTLELPEEFININDVTCDTYLNQLYTNNSDSICLPENFLEFNNQLLTDINENVNKNDESILEIDLNLYYNENIDLDQFLDQDFDNLFNESSNQCDLRDLNELFINDFDEKRQINQNDSIEMMFPYIQDEKNRRRRSLLYENNSRPKTKSKDDIKPYTERTYRRPDPLLNHDYTQKKSDEEKYFSCPVTSCDKVYAKASHLKAHLRRHSGEKPFACNWQNCNWKFSRSDELARHKRSHSGVKPYKCELCEKAFARSDHLAKHIKVHRKKMAQYGNYYIKKRVRLTN